MEEQKSIPLFDEFGRLIWTDREEFRIRVIPENLNADWDHPENLYTFTVQLYRDGFLEEASGGAKRLLELSDRAEEALLLQGLILRRQERDAEAETILQECIRRYPERGVAYTYLARLYMARSEDDQAIDALQRGLDREPNQETALRMLARLATGPEQAVELLRAFIGLEDSWWPQLELGRVYLDQGKVEEAMDQFASSMDRTRSYRGEEGLPEWEEEMAAMTVSALLRKYALGDDLIRFAEQYWTPGFLTPFTGLDYVSALEERGEIRKGVEVLEEMLPLCGTDYQRMLQLRIHQLDKKAAKQG